MLFAADQSPAASTEVCNKRITSTPTHIHLRVVMYLSSVTNFALQQTITIDERVINKLK
jgi:hypothetical protein